MLRSTQLKAVLQADQSAQAVEQRLVNIVGTSRPVGKTGKHLQPFVGLVRDQSFRLSRYALKFPPPSLVGYIYWRDGKSQIVIEGDASNAPLQRLIFRLAILLPMLAIIAVIPSYSAGLICIGALGAAVIIGWQFVDYKVWLKSRPDAFKAEIMDLALMLDAQVVEISFGKVPNGRVEDVVAER
jgi:hypothetical protein